MLFVLLGLTNSITKAETQTLWISAQNEAGEKLSDVAVSDNNQLRFLPNGIGVYDNDVLSATIPFEDLYRLTFSYSGTVGVESTVISPLRILENPVGETLQISGYDGEKTTVFLFDTGGRLHVAVKDWNGESIDVSNLSPGIYLGLINKTTFKIIKK